MGRLIFNCQLLDQVATTCNEDSSDRGSIKGKRLGNGRVGKKLIGEMLTEAENYNKSAKI